MNKKSADKPESSIWSSENLKIAIVGSVIVGSSVLWISGFMLFDDLPEDTTISIEARVRVATLIVTIVFAVVTFLTVMYRGAVSERQAVEAKRDNDAADQRERMLVFEKGVKYLQSQIDGEALLGAMLLEKLILDDNPELKQQVAEVVAAQYEKTFPVLTESEFIPDKIEIKSDPTRNDIVSLLKSMRKLGVRPNRTLYHQQFLKSDVHTEMLGEWIPDGAYIGVNYIANEDCVFGEISEVSEIQFIGCKFVSIEPHLSNFWVNRNNFFECTFRKCRILGWDILSSSTAIDCDFSAAIIDLGETANVEKFHALTRCYYLTGQTPVFVVKNNTVENPESLLSKLESLEKLMEVKRLK